MLPILDTFSSTLPDGLEAIVLTPDCVAPSSTYKILHYPTVLARHLMELLPEVQHETIENMSSTTPSQDPMGLTGLDMLAAEGHASNGFLGVSAMTKNMTVGKWGWTSRFSLSRSPDVRSGDASPADHGSPPRSISSGHMTQADRGALEDAISNISFGSVEKEGKQFISGHMSSDEQEHGEQDSHINTPHPSRSPSISIPSKARSLTHQTANEVDMSLGVQCDRVFVFLAPNDQPLATQRHSVCLFKVSRNFTSTS